MEPKRDQWWRLKGGKIAFVAFDDKEIRCSNSEVALRFLTYHKNKGNVFHHWRDLSEFAEHLPECTGFDWVPEMFPQYWSTGAWNFAFVKRIDKKRYVCVDKNGKESGAGAWYASDEECRKQLTEEQALAMLVKCPRYFVCNIHSPGYYRCDSEKEVFHVSPDGSEQKQTGCAVSTLKNGGVWTEVTEAEAKARVAKAYPKWYIGREPFIGGTEYVVRLSDDRMQIFGKDGKAIDGPWTSLCDSSVAARLWIEVSEKMAKGEGWVTQDRVPRRPYVDQYFWASKQDLKKQITAESNVDWMTTGAGIDLVSKHGDVNKAGNTLFVRCRRKDLPVVKEVHAAQWETVVIGGKTFEVREVAK